MTPIRPDARAGKLAAVWLITMLVLFVVLALLGIGMRAAQGKLVTIDPGLFYAAMTLHGLGMAGVLYSAGFGGLWLLCAAFAPVGIGIMRGCYVLIVAGASGLVAATLIGRFGTGWYVLYPLPFVNPTWASWATGLAIISLMLLGVAWLLGQLDLLRALARRFGVRRMFGWHWIAGEDDSTDPVPIVATIAAVVCSAGSLATVCGAAMLMLYLLQWLNPAEGYDALLLKNMVFLFGHTLVNIAMYCGVAFVYSLLPRHTGRAWKGNRIVGLAWNATLIFVLVAYFHHLYMDFAQPRAFQYFGQLASYLSAVPATAVTVFGAFGQVWRSDTKWTFVPTALIAGVVGWVIGGFAALLDATIVFNRVLHNTLWVPGHFHTYFIVGYILLLMAFVYDLFGARTERSARAALALQLVGGYGFVTMFYLGGIQSVPRRYAAYDAISVGAVSQAGTRLAGMGALFGTVFLVGFLALLVAIATGRSGAGAREAG